MAPTDVDGIYKTWTLQLKNGTLWSAGKDRVTEIEGIPYFRASKKDRKLAKVLGVIKGVHTVWGDNLYFDYLQSLRNEEVSRIIARAVDPHAEVNDDGPAPKRVCKRSEYEDRLPNIVEIRVPAIADKNVPAHTMRVACTLSQNANVLVELNKANIEFLQTSVHAHSSVIWPIASHSSSSFVVTWPWEEYPKCSYCPSDITIRISYTVNKKVKRFQKKLFKREGIDEDTWWFEATAQARLLHNNMEAATNGSDVADGSAPAPSDADGSLPVSEQDSQQPPPEVHASPEHGDVHMLAEDPPLQVGVGEEGAASSEREASPPAPKTGGLYKFFTAKGQG